MALAPVPKPPKVEKRCWLCREPISKARPAHCKHLHLLPGMLAATGRQSVTGMRETEPGAQRGRFVTLSGTHRMPETCGLCGRVGRMYGRADGVPLCHGDDYTHRTDHRPTCYEQWTVYGDRPRA